jgi:hypothetical protein
MKRTFTEPEKKVVAHRQSWRCSACCEMLPAAYQVDHTVPLCDDGPDTLANATAMCASCHAQKTQLETIARRNRELKLKLKLPPNYADRWDTHLPNDRVRCESCKAVRRSSAKHTVCFALEDPSGTERRLEITLDRFSFRSRLPKEPNQ